MSELIKREDAINAVEMFFEDAFIEDGDVHCTDMVYEINHIPTASPWHRVENGLPDKVGSYLVYAPTYRGGSSSAKECKAGVMFARWLKGGHWSIEVGYYKRPGCVTHWMPIEPPKEDA